MTDTHAAIGMVAGPTSAWLADARRAVQALLTLSPGWDSYAACAISGAAAQAALQLLDDAACLGCPAPSVVPMARGGIQLEWHIRQMSIEVSIPSKGSPVEVWSEDLIDQTERELLVEDDRGPLREIFASLAQRS